MTKIWLVDLYRYDSALLLCQFWWWLSGAQEGKKSTEKGNFWPFFDFFTLWFAIKSPSKISNPSDHTCQASQCKICCWFNWPYSTDCPWSREKYGFLRFFGENIFFNFIKWRHFFCTSWGLKSFHWWPRTIVPSSKRSSQFHKEYSLTCFKKIPF